MKNERASKNIKGGLCMKKKLSIIIVVLLLLYGVITLDLVFRQEQM